MSDNYICIISTDPWFLPETAAQQAACATLKRYAAQADAINVSVRESPAFIDCGANFERVLSPRRTTGLDDWWRTAMDEAAATTFTNLMITTPCCGTRTSRNDLRYEWPASFARFVLEAQNPNIGVLNIDQLQELARILGCPIRQILVHI